MLMFDKIISEETLNNIEKRKKNNFQTLFDLPYKQTFDGEDYCIMGVPYDTSVTNRTGCRSVMSRTTKALLSSANP